MLLQCIFPILKFSQKYKAAIHFCSTIISHKSFRIDDKKMFHWAVQRCLQEMCLVLAVKSGLLHKRRWMWLGIKILFIINKLNNWCFWTVCLRRLLRVPWTARSSNQSVLKAISPEYLLEGLMLKLNLQHFDYLIWRPDLLERTLMRGKIEGKRRRVQQRMRWLDGITYSMDMSVSKLQ